MYLLSAEVPPKFNIYELCKMFNRFNEAAKMRARVNIGYHEIRRVSLRKDVWVLDLYLNTNWLPVSFDIKASLLWNWNSTNAPVHIGPKLKLTYPQ